MKKTVKEQANDEARAVFQNCLTYRVYDEGDGRIDFVDHVNPETAIYIQQVQEYEFGWRSWIEVRPRDEDESPFLTMERHNMTKAAGVTT